MHNMIMTLHIVTNLTLNLNVIRNAGPDSAPDPTPFVSSGSCRVRVGPTELSMDYIGPAPCEVTVYVAHTHVRTYAPSCVRSSVGYVGGSSDRVVVFEV